MATLTLVVEHDGYRGDLKSEIEDLIDAARCYGYVRSAKLEIKVEFDASEEWDI